VAWGTFIAYLTVRVRCVRKNEKQSCDKPDIPKVSLRRWRRMSWSTRSNAADLLSMAMRVTSCRSTATYLFARMSRFTVSGAIHVKSLGHKLDHLRFCSNFLWLIYLVKNKRIFFFLVKLRLRYRSCKFDLNETTF